MDRGQIAPGTEGGMTLDIYGIDDIRTLIGGNPYPGRGILMGCTADGTRALAAYFIMGRSANSRNRIFTEKDGTVFTEPFDASKVQDPSLIIYNAVRRCGRHLIVTNGDQTDTVYDALDAGKSFAEALEKRQFEPDAPNYTPRISGMLTFGEDGFTYQLSILKSIDAAGSGCVRCTFSYPSVPGLGHLIHTYVGDGDPLPSFRGEPRRTAIGSDMDRITDEIWNALDAENRISLYVCTVDLETGKQESRLVNKNRQGGKR